MSNTNSASTYPPTRRLRDWTNDVTAKVPVSTLRHTRRLTLRAYAVTSPEEATDVTRQVIQARMRGDLTLDEMAEIRQVLISRTRSLPLKGQK